MTVESRAGGAAAAPGATVAGCRLLRPVGSGSAADVWLAVDRSTGQRVAVKLYRGGVLPAGERLRVRHPNVVAVRRIVENPPAVVLDLAAGGSVGSLVAARGPLDVGEVATVVVALAGALADLHGAGLVHGDLSPGNVLFTDGGRPLLADLGDAVVAGAGRVVATRGFAAPEVVAGSMPGGPSDVHGLCAVAWFALAGTAPDPVPPRVPLPLLVPAVPAELAQILATGLDPEPGRRPSPADLLGGVLAVAGCEPVRLVAGAFPALPRDEAPTHWLPRVGSPTGGPGDPPRRPPWRRLVPRGRRALHLTVVALVALVTGGLLAATGMGDRPAGTAVSGSPAPAASGALATVGASAPPSPPSGEPALAIVTELVAARQAALRGGDRAALARVYAPASPARATDEALVAEHGPLDVALDVVAVRVVATAEDRITVDVRLGTRPGGGAVPAGGTRVEEVEDDVRLTLVQAEGWRIDAVDVPG
ncbi:MAG: protein kinase [Kineosporiaceae bacterium]